MACTLNGFITKLAMAVFAFGMVVYHPLYGDNKKILLAFDLDLDNDNCNNEMVDSLEVDKFITTAIYLFRNYNFIVIKDDGAQYIGKISLKGKDELVVYIKDKSSPVVVRWANIAQIKLFDQYKRDRSAIKKIIPYAIGVPVGVYLLYLFFDGIVN